MVDKMTTQQLLDEEQAAIYINMSRSYLRRSRTDGKIKNRTPGPHWIKIGSRSIRYSIEDLDKWINNFPKYGPKTGDDDNA